MALALDTVSEVASNNTGTSVSWTHNCTGSDRAIFVYTSTTSQSAPTGVTCNGVAMTNVLSYQESNTGKRISAWKLANPASGSNTIVVTFASAVAGNFAAQSWTGALQTTSSLTGTPGTAEGISTTPSVAVSATAGDVVVDVLVFTEFTTVSAVGAQQTASWDDAGSAATGRPGSYGTTEAGSATVTMSYTLGAVEEWGIGAFAIKPSIVGSQAQAGQTVVADVPYFPRSRRPIIGFGFICEEANTIGTPMAYASYHVELPLTREPPTPEFYIIGPTPDNVVGGGTTGISSESIGPRISLPPPTLVNEEQWKRQAQKWMEEANQGHLQNTGIITLTANASSTTVTDYRVGPNSFIGFAPSTTNAANELRNGTMYVSSRGKQTFTIVHANNAQTDRTFTYSILG